LASSYPGGIPVKKEKEKEKENKNSIGEEGKERAHGRVIKETLPTSRSMQ
jgi:hypothetical protein